MSIGKYFNTEGLCRPGLHYMVDTSAKIDVIVRDYIERGRYFVINRARQYGKTTTLELLQSRLTDRFRIVSVSFEGAEDIFATTKSMARGISLLLMDALYPQEIEFLSAKIDEELPLRDLGKRITELCEDNVKPVILMIDEVDKTANYDVFASLLGLLRRKYLDREAQGMRSTFHSVILAGVHDIKNLKAKIHQDSEHSYNSPWNIAADFSVDMSFSANEIEGMLCGYEAERHTGMEAAALAKTIREQTSGYPYLVSALCKRLDEVTHDWTVSGLHAAVAHMMSTTNTLFDDIVKNLQRHAEFRSVVEDILLNGERVNYVPSNPGIALGEVFGILKKSGLETRISNLVFEQYIYNHIVSVNRSKLRIPSDETRPSIYVKDGRLDMRLVLERFAALMKAEYRAEYGALIEKEWRLLFLTFLRPIINGTGTYAVEAETRGNTRMDVVVFYGNEEHIVELKLWHGRKQETEAYSPLAGYLESRGQHRGYLISFYGLKKPPKRGGWLSRDDHEIYEEIIPYSTGDEVRPMA